MPYPDTPWISCWGPLGTRAATWDLHPPQAFEDTDNLEVVAPLSAQVNTSCDFLPGTQKHLEGKGCSWREGRKEGRRGRRGLHLSSGAAVMFLEIALSLQAKDGLGFLTCHSELQNLDKVTLPLYVQFIHLPSGVKGADVA